MTANIQISGKSNSGIIFVVGGDNYDDFFQNLVAVVGAEDAEGTVREAGRLIVPASAGDPAVAAAAQVVQNAFPGAQQAPWGEPPVPAYNLTPPAQATPGGVVCPTHQQAAIYKAPQPGGKQYSPFFKCPVNDSIITNYQKAAADLKTYCPPPKAR